MDWATTGYWLVLVLAGLACGLLNTLASSGSAVTLPIMMALGVPDAVANATNRLPVFLGFATSTASFARRKQLDWIAAAKLLGPLALGSIAGVLSAEHMSNRALGLLITGAILVALLLLFTKLKDALLRELTAEPVVSAKALLLMFATGFWLGLVVLDGATYLMLILMLVCSYPLAQANALKVALGMVATGIAIAMFWGAGEIKWMEGIVLSAGSVVGGYCGVLASNLPKAKIWAFRLLVVTISIELIHLGWQYWVEYRPAVESWL